MWIASCPPLKKISVCFLLNSDEIQTLDYVLKSSPRGTSIHHSEFTALHSFTHFHYLSQFCQPFVLSMFLLAVLISKIITDSDPSSHTISSRVCYYFAKGASSITICSRVRVVVDVFLSTCHFLQLLVYVLIIQWHHYYFLSVFWKHGTVSVGKIPFMKYLLTDTKSVRILQRLVHELNTIQRRWHLRW